MLSIGELAKAADVSTRAIRHYETLGLIRAAERGENNYRYFARSTVQTIEKIRRLQSLGFELDEIRHVLELGVNDLGQALVAKLVETDRELQAMKDRRARIQDLLMISQKIERAEALDAQERKVFMEAVKEAVLGGLRGRRVEVGSSHLEYLTRDENLYDSDEKRAFIKAVTRCVEFAAKNDLTLGPGRGSCPASIVLFGLGFSGIDPTRHDLLPERLSGIAPDVHIDVEYERGQAFVDFCRRESESLSWGKITAFKMPLLDIIRNVHRRVGKTIDYDAIPDDSPLVLDVIRRGDIEKIFLLDYSPEALIMKIEGFLPGYEGTARMKEYLGSQSIESFRDVMNIIALWRPHSPEILARLELYRKAKQGGHRYDFLPDEVQGYLRRNYGLIIYHEDIVRLIATITGWPMERCALLRRDLRIGNANPDHRELEERTRPQVFRLIMDEIPWTFCQPHTVAFSQLTKRTAVLKTLHAEVYLDEIARWQDRHGLVWDDIGVQLRGISLLQS